MTLTCVHKQARQGTEQLQGQGGQNEVQVQCAGLREGVLEAEQEEESSAASGMYHQHKAFKMPGRPVDLIIASVPYFAVVILDVSFKKEM